MRNNVYYGTALLPLAPSCATACSPPPPAGQPFSQQVTQASDPGAPRSVDAWMVVWSPSATRLLFPLRFRVQPPSGGSLQVQATLQTRCAACRGWLEPGSQATAFVLFFLAPSGHGIGSGESGGRPRLAPPCREQLCAALESMAHDWRAPTAVVLPPAPLRSSCRWPEDLQQHACKKLSRLGAAWCFFGEHASTPQQRHRHRSPKRHHAAPSSLLSLQACCSRSSGHLQLLRRGAGGRTTAVGARQSWAMDSRAAQSCS
jgi:hypothetical protein